MAIKAVIYVQVLICINEQDKLIIIGKDTNIGNY